MTEQIENKTETLETPLTLSFIDRHEIHPVLFAFLSLIFIFLLYQVGGGIITFLVIGSMSITRENVWTIRYLTVFGQLCFILLPTLFLARLTTTKMKSVFPFRIPGLLESTLALLALFSLQRVFEVYIFFQKLIPMPELVREFLEPIRKMFLELIKVLIRADSPFELFAVVFVVAITPSIVEELLFRGYIQKTFERMMSPIVAAILSGTIFGLYHINPFELVPLIGLGVFFGLLRFRSQSLWLPISAHFFNNFMAVLASYYGVQDDDLVGFSQSTANIPTMLLILCLFAVLFLFSFIAYLRITQNVIKRA